MIEYADKYGTIYHDKDLESMTMNDMNNLGLHIVDEDWQKG